MYIQRQTFAGMLFQMYIQPPEPPNLVCDNKKCGWVGMSEERIEDEEYNDHCPVCNGTEFSWIDYDPDTKAGRANREKYCRSLSDVADLEQALKELATELDTLTEDKGRYHYKGQFGVDAECVQCDWKGTVDETFDSDGEMVCPQCGEPVELRD